MQTSLMVATSSPVMHLKVGYELGFPRLPISVGLCLLFRSLRTFSPLTYERKTNEDSDVDRTFLLYRLYLY